VLYDERRAGGTPSARAKTLPVPVAPPPAPPPRRPCRRGKARRECVCGPRGPRGEGAKAPWPRADATAGGDVGERSSAENVLHPPVDAGDSSDGHCRCRAPAAAGPEAGAARGTADLAAAQHASETQTRPHAAAGSGDWSGCRLESSAPQGPPGEREAPRVCAGARAHSALRPPAASLVFNCGAAERACRPVEVAQPLGVLDRASRRSGGRPRKRGPGVLRLSAWTSRCCPPRRR